MSYHNCTLRDQNILSVTVCENVHTEVAIYRKKVYARKERFYFRNIQQRWKKNMTSWGICPTPGQPFTEQLH